MKPSIYKRYNRSVKGAERTRKYRSSPKGVYMMQRNKAKHRGIPWEFTFDTWWAMWKPYWEFRGNRRGLLVMARRGDYGAYSPSNCVIVSDHINRMHLI